jgi:hypothetical protein
LGEAIDENSQDAPHHLLFFPEQVALLDLLPAEILVQPHLGLPVGSEAHHLLCDPEAAATEGGEHLQPSEGLLESDKILEFSEVEVIQPCADGLSVDLDDIVTAAFQEGFLFNSGINEPDDVRMGESLMFDDEPELVVRPVMEGNLVAIGLLLRAEVLGEGGAALDFVALASQLLPAAARPQKFD